MNLFLFGPFQSYLSIFSKYNAVLFYRKSVVHLRLRATIYLNIMRVFFHSGDYCMAYLINKWKQHIKLQRAHHTKELSDILHVFMPEFYRLDDQNYTLLSSDLHTTMIAYSNLQVYMSGCFNTITCTLQRIDIIISPCPFPYLHHSLAALSKTSLWNNIQIQTRHK